MNIIIGSDHNGYEMKKHILNYLKELNYTVEDVGPYDFDQTDDFPIYAKKVGDYVLMNKENLGILICGTGIGMSIAANKIKGIMCAKLDNEEEAALSRQHNNANVMALSSKKSNDEVKKIIFSFINSEFLGEERLIRRIEEIENF